jgi:ABC-type phosphate/phosphonate transport system substrate-binding protein
VNGHPHVELGMYPFASVAWAWDELWAAVHQRAPWTPRRLTRSGDVHARWNDDDCIITHVCGWPFAARHRNDMHVIGAFTLDIDDAEPDGHYRSVLMSPHDRPVAELVGPGSHAVANSADSLSGWLSLRAATVGAGHEWPGTVTFTSAHRDSVLALANGEGDLASIDSWSLSFIAVEEPDLVRDLHRVGVGPRIPTPALTARKSIDTSQVSELRDAFEDALGDIATADARSALHIAGLARLGLDDYLETLPLGGTRTP